MNKKHCAILLTALLLTGCNKTKELYGYREYNSPVFDENYYLSYNGLDQKNYTQAQIKEITTDVFYEEDYLHYASGKNLSLVDDGFKEGMLSKLYDSRTYCGGLYQLSRVQLNKTGFATPFPISSKSHNQMKVKSAKNFIFAARGGTSPKTSRLGKDRNLNFEIKISLYKEESKIVYTLPNVILPTDNQGITAIVGFDVSEEISGTYGYSIEFKCLSVISNTTDDYLDKEKDHLALMLYEVLLPESTWF